MGKSNEPNPLPPMPPSHTVQVKYLEVAAKFSNHVLLNVNAEEVFIDFSSGVTPDPATGIPVLPVHTRIAMTHIGAQRFHQLLGQVLLQQPKGSPGSEPPPFFQTGNPLN